MSSSWWSAASFPDYISCFRSSPIATTLFYQSLHYQCFISGFWHVILLQRVYMNFRIILFLFLKCSYFYQAAFPKGVHRKTWYRTCLCFSIFCVFAFMLTAYGQIHQINGVSSPPCQARCLERVYGGRDGRTTGLLGFGIESVNT